MDRRDGYIMNEIMLRAENIERTYHAGSVDVPALKNCTLEFGGMKDKELSEFRRRNIGYIYQDYSLFPEFTAYENVVMPILIDGKKPDENEVDDLLEELGISHCKNKFPSQMSGGEQQRVAIARALITHPAVILADEPTGNLDSKTSAEVLGLIKRTSTEFRQTVVMITHNNDIARLADRIVR